MANVRAEMDAFPPISAPKPPGLLRQIVKHRYEYLYIAPAIGVMGLVILYPLIYTILLSFFNTPANNPNVFFNGVSNYIELAQDNLLGLVIRNTLYWTFGSTITSFALGLLAALLLNQRLPGSGIFSAIMVIPYVIGQVTAAYLWRWLMHGDFGVISLTLMEMGLLDRPISFLQDPALVMTSLVIVNTWKSFPFAMIMLLAGLQAIPQDLYKAARVDGANRFQQFIEITVPQLMPVILVTSVLLIIGNMNSFTIPYLMTGGGPAHQSELVITWVYNESFQALRFGFASAISVALFIVLLIFSYFYVRALTRGQVSSAGE
ncbi:MAG: sugar ABC transporter permease [Chloroflexota bacterium]|nr:sugar ABC transporter permease [Chloroflexota bacterium]